MMSSLDQDWMVINLNLQEKINFQMFDEEYLISYTDFFVRMGLVDVEYILIESYS